MPRDEGDLDGSDESTRCSDTASEECAFTIISDLLLKHGANNLAYVPSSATDLNVSSLRGREMSVARSKAQPRGKDSWLALFYDSIKIPYDYIDRDLSPSPTHRPLPQLLSRVVHKCYARRVCPEKELTITSGASEGLYLSIRAFISKGDEVVLFDPSHPRYTRTVTVCGGIPRHVPMTVRPQLRGQSTKVMNEETCFEFDWEAMRRSISSLTRAIIINTPHNPTGRSFNVSDWRALEAILSQWPSLYVISDERFEFVNFVNPHSSSASCFPSISQRTCIVSSFEKILGAELNVGCVIAPPEMTESIRTLHCCLTSSGANPQHTALGNVLSLEVINKASAEMREKRDVAQSELLKSRFRVLPCQGTFYQLLEYSDISGLSDIKFCEFLIKHHKVATLPLSAFYHSPPPNDGLHIIRVCFAAPSYPAAYRYGILCDV